MKRHERSLAFLAGGLAGSLLGCGEVLLPIPDASVPEAGMQDASLPDVKDGEGTPMDGGPSERDTGGWNEVRLAVVIELPEWGRVVSSPPGIACPPDCVEHWPRWTEIALTAAATVGGRFEGWSGVCSGTTPQCTFPLNHSVEVNADFQPETYPVSVTLGAPHTSRVRSLDDRISCPPRCTHDFKHGESLQLIAEPDVESRFDAWSGACETRTLTCTRIIEGPVHIHARFEPKCTCHFTESQLGNAGFESPQTIGPTPGVSGYWSGDRSRLAFAENGVIPRTGHRMLRFEATRPEGPGPTEASQIRQELDVSALRPQIDAGLVEAHFCARFNRVPGYATTDRQFGARLLTRSRAAMWVPFDPIELISDADVQTWEPVAGQSALPAGTTRLAFEIYATEDVLNDSQGSEYDGHYADDTCLSLKISAPR